jgi:quinohemoprotein ethanol dehydrogenase
MAMKLTALLSALLLFAAGCRGTAATGGGSGALTAAAVDDAILKGAAARSADWLMNGRTYDEQRFSPLAQLNDGNVARLGLAWTFETGTDRGLEATPLVVDGVLYTTGSWSVVFALDARSGRLLWKWDPKVDPAYGARACCDVVNRGAALYRGKIYVGLLDGRLAALDARTGKVAWEVLTVDRSKPYTVTGAPRIVKGQVIIGNGGAEYGVRGYVSAYDAETGALRWRFYTVPGDPSQPFESEAMRRAAATWTGRWWEMGGGGTVWDSMAFDPELNLLYVGTGNGSPWNRDVRSPGGGDNLYLASILALDADTGDLVWHYQTVPGDTWDYTATQPLLLANLEIGGTTRRVLMQAPKNGFFYVLDRKTGELLSAEAIVPVTWASGVDRKTGRPVEVPGSRYGERGAFVRPNTHGAHNWHPMSFNPKTGLVYIPAQENGRYYSREAGFRFMREAWNIGVAPDRPPADVLKNAPPKSAFLLAWDPERQQEKWRVPHATYWNGGTLTTAGNLVFQGTAGGDFVAYRATNGEKLWQSWVPNGIVAAPITYQVEGKQYVAFMAGWGGGFVRSARNSGKLVALTLEGQGKPFEREPPPVVSALPLKASPGELEKGRELYQYHCAYCHQGSLRKDPRYSAEGVFDVYPDILLKGIMVDAGMPSFEGRLTREEVMALRAFVISERNRLAVKTPVDDRGSGGQ